MEVLHIKRPTTSLVEVHLFCLALLLTVDMVDTPSPLIYIRCCTYTPDSSSRRTRKYLEAFVVFVRRIGWVRRVCEACRRLGSDGGYYM